MNLIEEKYRIAKKLLGFIRRYEKEKKKKMEWGIETIHYVAPLNNKGVSITTRLNEIARELEKEYIIVIAEFMRDIDADGIEEQIMKSMAISKQNINKILTENKITDGGGVMGDDIMQSLIKDSQPQ